MRETFDSKSREREERRARDMKLEKLGWRSTGDVPYFIARSLNKSSAVITINIRSFLESILGRESEDYRNGNVIKSGVKTFVSPDLMTKLEQEAKDFFYAKRKLRRNKTDSF